MTKPDGVKWLAFFTGIVLWWQAHQSAWNSHMQVDTWISWQRVEYWFAHSHSFLGLSGNEILPATLLYVFAPTLLSPNSAYNYAIYLPLSMLLNFVVVACHGFFVKDTKVFLTSLLFLGPILFFRFEPMVTLFMLLSFNAFTRENFKLSGFWLGLATAMKVFPVIFLPYLLLILFKRKNTRAILGLLLFFGEALLASVLAFLLMGGSMAQIYSALAFHSQKLISIESIPGSIITGWALFTNGVPPTLIPGNGIWSVAGPAHLFNDLWMIPVGFIYVFIAKSEKLLSQFSYIVPYALLLIFLVFSKNLNPQYLWWFIVLLPMIKPTRFIWGVTLLTALLNQLVFPIYYTTFIDSFYRAHHDYWIYYLLLLRNLGVVVIAYYGMRDLVVNSKNTKDKS
jgi:uncharacterized membrane protein